MASKVVVATFLILKKTMMFRRTKKNQIHLLWLKSKHLTLRRLVKREGSPIRRLLLAPAVDVRESHGLTRFSVLTLVVFLLSSEIFSALSNMLAIFTPRCYATEELTVAIGIVSSRNGIVRLQFLTECEYLNKLLE